LPQSDSRMAEDHPEELATRLRQQRRVVDLGRAALRGAPFDALLQEAAEIAAEGLGTRLSKVMQFLPEENALLVRAGVGWREGIVGVAKLGAGTASPAGYALMTGAPVVSNHLATESRFRTPLLMAEHGVRRAVNVIIAGQGRPFGVLEADSRKEGMFDDGDIAFLQVLAHMLGLALEREQERLAREALLAEKDLLMQEVHHRVKNSLQIVQSILSLQARSAGPGTDPQAVLQDAVRRVTTVAAVHERLYRTGTATEVEVAGYLEGLVSDLRTTLCDKASRPLVLQAERAVWPAAEIAPVGLLLTELVTNAVKHGMGTITVRFTAPRDRPARLSVEDEGRGLPPGLDPATGRGLGMRLIAGLLRGRHGRLVVEREEDGRARFVAVLGREAEG